jgi:hypothetical protein
MEASRKKRHYMILLLMLTYKVMSPGSGTVNMSTGDVCTLRLGKLNKTSHKQSPNLSQLPVKTEAAEGQRERERADA